jgi:hypothetical protein
MPVATCSRRRRYVASVVSISRIPDAFAELERAGRFDYWGAPYDSLTDEARTQLMPARTRQVLWWDHVIEWDRTVEDVLAFDGGGRLRPGLVPFASNGVGDHFCWYPNWQTAAEPPVVFFEHDALLSRLFARDFSELLCRCMLQHFAVALDEDDADHDDLWAAHLAIVRPFLSVAQVQRLTDVGAALAAAACAAADAAIAAEVGVRTLLGAMQPVQFNDDAMSRDVLLRAYDRSVSFYQELAEVEGLTEYSLQLEQVIAARDHARDTKVDG